MLHKVFKYLVHFYGILYILYFTFNFSYVSVC